MLDHIKNEFPALLKKWNDLPVIFADNASTTLKPYSVIKAVTHFYTDLCSNVHRGTHGLSQEAERLFENTRIAIAEFINALPEEIVFVKNTTEAINLASHCSQIGQDDEILCSVSEHHSNFLPWLSRYKLKLVTPDAAGNINIEGYRQIINPKTKLISLGYISNVTGSELPVKDVVRLSRSQNILTLIDASQAISHIPIDVKELDCDFLAFSGHKIFGPSGVGVLFVKKSILDRTPPFFLGGSLDNNEKPITVPN
jgi:cysteine desulfurase/selenocysteine lyase